MLNRRNLLRGISSTTAVTLLGSHAESRSQAAPAIREPIRVGQSAVFSGPSADSGNELKVGIEACFNQVNKRGGINGRPIRLVAMDDGYDPDRCVANTRALIEKEKVDALVGYFGTATSMAALPILTAAGVALVGPYSGASVLRFPTNKNVFNVRASYEDEGAAIVRQLLSTGANRLAIFYQNDGFGIAVRDAIERNLAVAGLKPTAVAAVERNSIDVRTAIEVISQSNCNAVALGCLYAPGAALMNGLINKFSLQYASTSAIGTGSLMDALGERSRGLLLSQVMPYPFKTSGRLAIQRDYHDAMIEHGKNNFNYGSIEGYINARVLLEGLRRAGPFPARANIVAGLESIGAYDFGGFKINYAPSNHTGSTFVEMTIIGRDGAILR